MDCPAITELMAFVHHEPSVMDEARVKAHLADCADCARTVAGLRRTDEALALTPFAPVKGPGRCLNSDEIDFFLTGSLPVGLHGAAEGHLSECPRCAAELAMREASAASASDAISPALRDRLYAIGNRSHTSTRSIRKVTPSRLPAANAGGRATARVTSRSRRLISARQGPSSTWAWAAAAAAILVAFVFFLAPSGGPVPTATGVAAKRRTPEPRVAPEATPKAFVRAADQESERRRVPAESPESFVRSPEPATEGAVPPPAPKDFVRAPEPAVPAAPQDFVQAPEPGTTDSPTPSDAPTLGRSDVSPAPAPAIVTTEAAAAESFVSAEKVEGSLFILRDSGREALRLPTTLGPGDRLTPGGEGVAKLTLKNGVAVTFHPAAIAALAFLGKEARAHLEAGEVYAEVPKNRGGFRVISGPNEAVVKGTKFAVRRDGDAATLIVEEGAVLLRRDGKEVLTKAGQSAVAGPDGVSAPKKADVAAELAWRRPDGPVPETVVYLEDFSAVPVGPVTENPFLQGVMTWGVPAWSDPPDDWVQPNPASHRIEADPSRKGRKILRATKEAGKSAHLQSRGVSVTPGGLYAWRVRLRASSGGEIPVLLAAFGAVSDFDYYEYNRPLTVGGDWREFEIPFVAVDRAPKDHRTWLSLVPDKDGTTVDVDEARLVRKDPGARRLHAESFAAIDPAVWTASPAGWTVKGSTFIATEGASAILKGGAAWRDYTVHASFDVPRFGPAEAGIVLRAKDAANRLELDFVHHGENNGVWELRRIAGGQAAVLASKPAYLHWHPWGQIQQFSLVVRVRGPLVQAWVNGELLLAAQDAALPAGPPGLAGHKGSATFTGFSVVRD